MPPGHDIITIGASAGGFEAVSNVIAGLPADLPASVFVVVHIPPDLKSFLPNILQRVTRNPVVSPSDGEEIRRGHIYVAPPDHHLLVDKSRVRLGRGPRENLSRPAIDSLFRTAALNHGPRVVGVILSGNLDDGTAGLMAIKRFGGIAIVQDPGEVLFPSMPRSAIENVNVDFIVPVAQIATRIVELVHQPAANVEGAPVPDNEMKMEAEIPKLEQAVLHDKYRPGKPSTFACPECGGALWEIDEGDMPRFRCRVGHAYSPGTLLSEQSDAIESSLWMAVRALQESATLSLRLMERARKRGETYLVERFERQARDAEQRAELLRGLLLKGELGALSPPHGQTPTQS